jgi:integrase
MASISNDPNGHKRILFVDKDGNRKAIRLGKMSKRMAETINVLVQNLNAAQIGGGCSLDEKTAEWLVSIGDDLHAKLAAVGLTTPRRTARLGEFLNAFIANRRTSAASNTITNLEAAARRLREHFGSDRDMRSVTPADADGWAAALAEKYAPATAGRTIKRARQFFKVAIRDKIITANPFAGIKASGAVNEDRQVHIDAETIAQVIDAAPDHEWRLIIALSRFGGLRCPSEHLALRWQDIDWARDRFAVKSPKTGRRLVPIFPELRPYLTEAFERAEEGEVYVIHRYRHTNANLRTTFAKIIQKAGVQPWPKLFHNLRASRETELVAKHPIHVVCKWIGNTPAIAAKHYLTVRAEDFERASQGGAKSGAIAAQNQAQQASSEETRGIADETEAKKSCEDTRRDLTPCGATQNNVLPPRGLEPLS